MGEYILGLITGTYIGASIAMVVDYLLHKEDKENKE